MPFCRKCGFEYKEGDQFCESCGATLEEERKEVTEAEGVVEVKGDNEAPMRISSEPESGKPSVERDTREDEAEVIIKIVSWLVGGFFIILGLNAVYEVLVGKRTPVVLPRGLLVILIGLITIPPFSDLLKRDYNIVFSGWRKALVVIFLFGILIATPPGKTSITTSSPEASAPTAEAPIVQKEVLPSYEITYNKGTWATDLAIDWDIEVKNTADFDGLFQVYVYALDYRGDRYESSGAIISYVGKIPTEEEATGEIGSIKKCIPAGGKQAFYFAILFIKKSDYDKVVYSVEPLGKCTAPVTSKVTSQVEQ